MGDAGTMGGAASDQLTASGIQTVTGAKTFNDQKLIFRNPLDTFSGTITNPEITAASTIELGYDTPRNIIYVQGSNYKFKNGITQAVTSSASANTCFSNAFSSGQNGFIEVREGTYPITAQISNIRLEQHVFLSRGAIIQVPNGYTGTVFSLNNTGGARNAILEGGQINEAGTPSRLWTAVELNSTTSAGVCFNHIKNMDITDAGTGILMKCDGTAAFVNGNTISNTNIYGSKICVDFQLANSGTKINANLFSDIRGQSTAVVDYGFKNVTGKYNTFHHCYVYDMSLDGTSISMNIASGSQSTVIVGGFIDHQNYVDLGVGTIRLTGDIGINGLDVPVTKNTSYEDSVAMTAPASPSTGTTRRYTKTIDSNNDGLFYKARVNGAVVEVAM